MPMRDNEPGGGAYYGWVVLGAAVVIVGVGMTAIFSLGIFLKPIQNDLGWGRAEISGIALVTWSALGLGSIVWGIVSDRFGVRAVVAIGGLQLGLGLVLSSQVSTLWQFYAAFGALAGIALGAFYAPLTSTATQWFVANRGLAVALVSAGSGIGTFIMAPLVRWFISLYGWRTAMLALGDLMWLVIVPLALVLRNRSSSPLNSESPLRPTAGEDFALHEVFRAPQFWVIAVTHFACCVAHSGPLFHMVAYAMDHGAGEMIAATIFAVTSLASVVGRIVSGVLADRFGNKRTLVVILTMQAAAILLYLTVSSPPSLYALGVLFGLAYGGVMPLYALMTREYFGGRAMGGAYGAVFMLQAIGMGFGAYAGGWLYDEFAGYGWLYAGAGIIGVSAVLIASILRAPRRVVAGAAAPA